MPYFRELNEKEARSKENESGNADQVFQQVSQGGAGVSPSYEREGLLARSDNDRLFSFITEERLQEAQEFRRKGYNSHVPEVDPGLMTQLREALADTKSRLCIQAGVVGPLGSLWLLEQVDKITRLTGHLSDGVIKGWIEQALPGKSGGETAESELGSRRTAQSLARRLESTLQTLIRVVHTLRAIDDYSTPEKRHDVLVDELTGAFSGGDNSTVIQALNRMTAETSGHSAWVSLMQKRAAAWETGKPVIVNAMIETSRHEAEKANKKARVLQGASQAFFSHVAAYLQGLSSDLAKASINASQNTSSPAMPLVNNDEARAPLLHSNSLTQRIKTDYDQYKLKIQTTVEVMKGHAHRLVRITKHGHPAGTPTKDPEHVVADSIIRSILWQWQQPAIKIQYASAALLSKVDELIKIEETLASFAVADSRESEQESHNITVSHSAEDEMDVLVREWVSDSIEQEKPENQLAAKVVTMERLLRGDVARARNLVKRLGKTEESIQNMLRRQRFAVLKMIVEHFPAVAPSLKKVDKLLPDMTRDLTASIIALDKAQQLAEYPARNFSEAKVQAGYAQLLATKVKESLSAVSARLTERPLDDHSRGSRLAKHWANLAKTQSMGNYPVPDAELVLSILQERGLLTGILSTGDPAGYLFATRLAGELENASNDELRLPMSPDQYTALEKGLVEYIVKWGQRKTSHGVSRIVIELSFEQALDTVSFNVSSLLRVPYKLLKASIKIPYKVNKVNNYTMPGHDKPYKAIYGLLGKRLKQLGFNLVTAPVPGMIKFAGGAWITAGATLHNLHIDNREKSFSAVYQHVSEGKQSEKIKMNSVKEMIFDSVTDTASTAAFKGAGRAWKSRNSKNNVIPDKDFVIDHFTERDEETHSQAQQGGMAGDNDNLTWGNQQSRAEVSRPTVTEGGNLNREAESLTEGLKPDNAVHPDEKNGNSESDGYWKSSRPKRSVAKVKTNITRSNFDRLFDNKTYSDLPDNVKKSTYFYGIRYLLRQIENDEDLPQQARNNAYLARMGAPVLVTVDIFGHKINNAFFVPDNPSSKSGVLVRLNASEPYRYVAKGSDLASAIKYDLPYDANRMMYAYPGVRERELTNAMGALKKVRSGKWKFERYFNYDEPDAVDISTLSKNLSENIEDDFKHRSYKNKNNNLIQRAIAGSQMPEPDVSVAQVKYKLEFTWENLTPAEYLRSFSKPFSTLAGQVQLIVSDVEGQSIQQTEQSVGQAQYIGGWIDASVGVVTSFSGAGIVLGMAQSAAGIAADVAEGKDPDPLMVAGLIIGCIPGGKIATRVGKFSKIGGKSVKYFMMIGNKTIDLAIVGKSIKSAVESGEPLEIYQALLTSGMSVKNSYDMARGLSSELKIKKTMEESAQLKQLEAIQNNVHEYSIKPKMAVRTFKIGLKELLGKINEGEIEISRDNGSTWTRGSKIHLLAYRLQNAGGVPGKPEKSGFEKNRNPQQKAGSSGMGLVSTRYMPKDRLAENLNRTVDDLPKYSGDQESHLDNPDRLHMTEAEIDEARESLLKDLLSTPAAKAQLEKITEYPAGQCDTAAKKVLELLEGKGYETSIIGVLNYKTLYDTTPMDHYVVLATKNGKSLVIDSTFEQYLTTHRREWVITSLDKWQGKLVSTDHLKNKLVIAKEYKSIQKAYNDIHLPDPKSWLQSKYITDAQFKNLKIPEFMIRQLKSEFNSDVDFLNSKNAIERISKASSDINNEMKNLIKLKEKENSYIQNDKNVPDKLADSIKSTERKIAELKKTNELPSMINNILLLAKRHPELRAAGTKLSSSAYNELVASKLTEKITYYRDLSPVVTSDLSHSSSAAFSNNEGVRTYAGPSSNHQLSFDNITEHKIDIRKINRLILSRVFSGNRIQSFNYQKDKFEDNNDFTISRYPVSTDRVKDTISKETLLTSILDIKNKVKKIREHLNDYSGIDKEVIINNLTVIESCLNEIKDGVNSPSSFTETGIYALSNRNASLSDINNHYGLASFDYDHIESNLHISNLTAHPYVVVNKYPAFRNYLIKNKLIPANELFRFNIKNIARYFGVKSIKSEVHYYESIPSTKVKSISFHGSNPITQRLGRKLESYANYYSSRKHSKEPLGDDGPELYRTSQDNDDYFPEQVDYLKSIVRTSFSPIQPIETMSDEGTSKYINKVMLDNNAEIISHDVVASTSNPDIGIRKFSENIISSVDKAYDKVSAVKTLFDAADSNHELEENLKISLNEAVGLNDEVLIELDKTDVSSISDMAYNRFRENINQTHDFLKLQKDKNYNSFIIFKHNQFDLSKPDAYALPFDSKKRILLAMEPEHLREGLLVNTVVHESSHNAAYTLDHTYLGNVQKETGSFPSSFEYSARDPKYFSENERVGRLSTNYALGLPTNNVPTPQQEMHAKILLQNSRLIKADTLVNSAEYNTYMIDVLSRARINDSDTDFHFPEPRNRRMASDGDDRLDRMIMLASLKVSGNYHSINTSNDMPGNASEAETGINPSNPDMINSQFLDGSSIHTKTSLNADSIPEGDSVITPSYDSYIQKSIKNPGVFTDYGFPGDFYYQGGNYWRLKSEGRPSDNDWNYPSEGESDVYWTYIGKHNGTRDDPKKWNEYGFPGDYYQEHGNLWQLKSEVRPSDSNVYYSVEGESDPHWQHIEKLKGTMENPKSWDEYGFPGDIYKEGDVYWKFNSRGWPSKRNWYYPSMLGTNVQWTKIGKHTGTRDDPKKWNEYGFPGDYYQEHGNLWQLKSEVRPSDFNVYYSVEGESDPHWQHIEKLKGTMENPKSWDEYGFPGDIYKEGDVYWKFNSRGWPSKRNWYYPSMLGTNVQWTNIGKHTGTRDDPKKWNEYGFPGDYYQEHGNLWQLKSEVRPSDFNLYYSVEGESDPHWQHIEKLKGTMENPKSWDEYGFPGDIYKEGDVYWKFNSRGWPSKRNWYYPSMLGTNVHWTYLSRTSGSI